MSFTTKTPSPPAIVRLWLLRLVLKTRVIEGLAEDWPDARICTALGISVANAKRQSKLREQLEPMLASAESNPRSTDTISRNIEHLAERLNLTETERSLLAFAAHAESERALIHCLRAFDDDDGDLYDALAIALGAQSEEIARALRADGTLRGAQLLRTERTHRMLMGPLLLAPMLARSLRRPSQGVDELLARFFAPSKATSAFGIDDFPHLAQEIDVATRILRGALDARATGVNLLLHGAPGSGKTELARVVARLADAPLYEVSVTDDEGDAAHGHERLAAYALSQRSLRAMRRAIVLFDEIEDVLPRKSFAWAGVSRETGLGKGWLARSLEESPVPSIWIANNVDHIDPAYLRRFAFVVEVPEPPSKVRRRMLGQALDSLALRDAYLQKLAERRGLMPAHVQQARTVLTLVRPRDEREAEQLLDRVLDGNLRVLDDAADSSETFSARLDLGDYDLTYVNASMPLDDVVRGLARSRRATALLSGPPGTGKTAFAAHVGRALDMPVVARRVSDLQSCWVGETEKNLAKAFRQAAREGAILFLDEADSFFQSRERATRSWEISQVNELLVNMEYFEGILICATNLLETFDGASMRRFDLKIRFEPLNHEQRSKLFEATLQSLSLHADDDDSSEGRWIDDAALRDGIRRLSGLTPGDFAAAARRLRLLGVSPEPARLLLELETEQSHKRDGRSGIAGFRRGPSAPLTRRFTTRD